MDSDFRNRYQQRPTTRHNQFARPQSHMPADTSVPVTDQAPATKPEEHAKKKRRKNKKLHKPSKKLAIVGASLVVVGAVGSTGYWLYAHPHSNKDQTGVLSQSTTKSGLPIYTVSNLPSGFVFNNDGKEIKPDVYFSTVTGPDNRKLYITQQRVPTDFDFHSFNQKFLEPDTFDTTAGTVVAGTVGTTNLGSIQTNKNSWIIINTDSGTPVTMVEAVARSLQPSQ